MIWATIAVAMLGVSVIGSDDIVSTLSPSAPVEVVSTDHRVEFPERIILSVEIESTYQVQDIKLFYRLGRLETTVYAHPRLYKDSGTLHAEFAIPTGGVAFIPEGVHIEYYYQVRNIRGEHYESQLFHLDYLDPQYNWQRLDAGLFEVLWHDRTEEAVRTVANQVSQGLQAVSNLLGETSSYQMRAVILNDRREANQAFPLVSQTATRGHLYGGFAYPDYDVFVLSGLSVDGMLHEMTHLLIGDVIDSPMARIPAWLNEGLAMYFETGPDRSEKAVANASLSDKLLSLRNMGAVPGIPSDVRLFYAQSWSIVDFAIETFGSRRMSKLLSAINSGKSIEDAISNTYGISIDKFESRWRKSIEGDTSITYVVDPGTLGTSLLIATAMLITAAAFTIRWMRNDRSSSEYDE